MSFFKTKERVGDRSIGDSARAQRRQQLQIQQQVLEHRAEKWEPVADPAMAGAA